MTELVEYIKRIKRIHYADTLAFLLPIILKNIKEKKYIITEMNDMKDFSTVELLECHGQKTSEFVRNLIEDIYAKSKETDDKNLIKIKIFAKRFNMNSIIIRFEPLNFKIIVVNVFFDFNIYENNNIKGIADWNLILHNIYHRLAFPESYPFNEDAITKFANLEKGYFSSLRLKKPTRKIKLRPLPAYTEKILKQWNKDIIWIGSAALKKYVKNPHPITPYTEVIAINNFQTIVNLIRKKTKTRYVTSDFEMFNFYVEAFHKGAKILRIYNGKYYCFKHRKFNNTKRRYGTYLLVMKYLFLHGLSNPNIKKWADYASYELYRSKKKSIFASPECDGKTVSSYRRYYLQNWGKKPWNYVKHLFGPPRIPKLPATPETSQTSQTSQIKVKAPNKN